MHQIYLSVSFNSTSKCISLFPASCTACFGQAFKSPEEDCRHCPDKSFSAVRVLLRLHKMPNFKITFKINKKKSYFVKTVSIKLFVHRLYFSKENKNQLKRIFKPDGQSQEVSAQGGLQHTCYTFMMPSYLRLNPSWPHAMHRLINWSVNAQETSVD